MILKIDGKLYNLEDIISYPDKFVNEDIEQMSDNINSNTDLVLVLYKNGNFVCFNYRTGAVVNQIAIVNESIGSYFKKSVSSVVEKSLNQEEEYINKRANSLPAACYEKLRSIVDASKEQVGLLQLQIDRDQTNYLSDFSDKIDNPMICIEAPYENILPSMIEGKK